MRVEGDGRERTFFLYCHFQTRTKAALNSHPEWQLAHPGLGKIRSLKAFLLTSCAWAWCWQLWSSSPTAASPTTRRPRVPRSWIPSKNMVPQVDGCNELGCRLGNTWVSGRVWLSSSQLLVLRRRLGQKRTSSSPHWGLSCC